MSLSVALRRVMRRDILLLCAVVFAADVVLGMMSPTFSLFAQSLGASLALVGLLTSTAGLTQFFISVPLGALSDRHGRKTVLVLGLLGFALAMLSFAVAPNPWFLFPGRILIGLGTTAIFWIGVAYLGDIITAEERGPAFGVYTTAMGLGFTLGPLLAALIERQSSVRISYLVGAVIALATAGLAGWGLRTVQRDKGGVRSVRVGFGFDDARYLLRNPSLLAGSIGNLAVQASFSAAVFSFFPILAAGLGATPAAISSMFSARAFGSAAARLPTGMILTKVSTWLVISLALVATLAAMTGMAISTALGALAALLVVEGIAYGVYLTAGQAFVAEHSSPTTRGSSIGVYTTAGSVGSTLGPIALGVIADLFGVVIVFSVTAVIVLVALFSVVVLYTRRGTTLGRTPTAIQRR
ncbi:MAG: MFS transporter [Anaerolineae bacterium]|nr:MFS transporter [Anaerolineae bacterium]